MYRINNTWHYLNNKLYLLTSDHHSGGKLYTELQEIIHYISFVPELYLVRADFDNLIAVKVSNSSTPYFETERYKSELLNAIITALEIIESTPN